MDPDPPADTGPVSSRAIRLVAVAFVLVTGVVATAWFAPPLQFVCQYALDFNTQRYVQSYVEQPLDEALEERSYCVRPTHNTLACDPSEATVVAQNIVGPQQPLHSTSRLAFQARC